MKTRRCKYKGADAMKETLETMIANRSFKLYGPLKALSEKEAEKWFPGKDTDHSAWINRWAAGRKGSFYLLAGPDRSRRRSACAG